MIYLSHTESRLPEKIAAICADIRNQNPKAMIYRDDFRKLDDSMFMDLIAAIPADREASCDGDPHDCEDHEEHHHGHDHDHGHRHADDIFSTAALRNVRLPSETAETFIAKLRSGDFGRILRGKGYVRNAQGELLYVDVTPADSSCRKADPEKAGNKADIFVVIGCGLDESTLQSVF